MQRTLFRLIFVGALTGALVAVSAGSAFAAHGHGRFAPRFGGNGGPGGPGGPGGFFGGPGGFGGGMGGPGMRGPDGPGGGGVLNADVLTAAASCLKISSVSTLTSDLAGGKTLAQEATANGSTAAALISCLVAAQTKVYDNDKAAGWITADQETALVSGYTDAVTDLVNNGPPVPPGPGGGQGGPLQAAASYLGVSVLDLVADLKSGKSLADIVGATSGKSVDGLVQALEAPVKTKLDATVTAGTITQAQENAILAEMTIHLTNLVNKTPPTQSNTVRKNLKKFMTLHRYNRRLR
jgi:hypothetical protein